MKCKIFYVVWIFLLIFSDLIATMEVYDYLQVEELIEKNNNAVEERLCQDWDTNDIIINYQNDFQLANSGKLIFKADVNNSQTIIQKKESEPIRLFAKYQQIKGV